MYCKSLWIQTSTKCINVNLNVNILGFMHKHTQLSHDCIWLIPFNIVKCSHTTFGLHKLLFSHKQMKGDTLYIWTQLCISDATTSSSAERNCRSITPITDDDQLKGIIEDCGDILLDILCSILFYFFKHLFMFNVYCHLLMYSTNNCC